MREERRQNHITALAAVTLLAVFAVSILLALLAGAGAYRRLVDRDAAAFDGRTAAQYIATRVRQSDGADAVAVEDFCGLPCLTLKEWNGGDGSQYVTRLYCYDGSLWELYTAADVEAELTDGERVLDLAGLELSLEDGLLNADLTLKSGETETVYLSLRSGEVGA